MNSIGVLLLFALAILLSAAIVVSFLPYVQRLDSIGTSATEKIANRAAICIQSVYSDGTDTNIYFYAVSGTLRLEPRVYVDGVDANVISVGLLRDDDSDGYLDRGDLAYVEISGNVFDGSLHRITLWLGTTSTEVTVLNNGDMGNCG